MQHILITGCTKGLGYELAINFAKQGIYVLAVGRTEKTLAMLAANYAKIIPISADITTQQGRENIIATIKQYNITQLSVIHNATISQPQAFSDLSEQYLIQQVATNYTAPLVLTKNLLPYLADQRILHISSGAASMPLPGLLPYCSSKAAMQHAITCLAKEYSAKNSYFANLRPGLMDTSMMDHWLELDEKQLPMVSFYQQAKANKKLIPAALAAKFVSWVMLNTSHEAFEKTYWNIYDKAMQHCWLPEGQQVPEIT